jgi:hypothetical protein
VKHGASVFLDFGAVAFSGQAMLPGCGGRNGLSAGSGFLGGSLNQADQPLAGIPAVALPGTKAAGIDDQDAVRRRGRR